MRQTRKTLLTLLIFFLFLLIGIISLYESAILLPGKLSGDKSIVYVQMIMQLSTLALIPTALYLFRIPYINKNITSPNSWKGFLRWSSVRLCLLCLPAIFNILFYYLYGEEIGFFYLALILTISIFFIFPTNHRCKEERISKKDKMNM